MFFEPFCPVKEVSVKRACLAFYLDVALDGCRAMSSERLPLCVFSGVAKVQVFSLIVRQYCFFTHLALLLGCFRVIFCQSMCIRRWSHTVNCFLETTVRYYSVQP